MEVFRRWTMGRASAYAGVSVTFSSDPCEKELMLVKESASRPVPMRPFNNASVGRKKREVSGSEE